MRHAITLLLALCCLAGAAAAAPLDPALQSELMELYDRHNAAIRAGKLTDAIDLRGAEARAQIQAEPKKPHKAQAALLKMARQMVPDRVEPLHATQTRDGRKATIVTLGTKTIPATMRIPGGPKPGTVMHGEITLVFEREGTAWRLADQIFGMDPADIKACTDESAERIAAYDADRDISLGGPIRRVEFRPDHTLVAIRVVDEEDCAILPNREGLAKLGIDPDALVPYTIVEMSGSPHKTDKQRAWATSLRVQAEE